MNSSEEKIVPLPRSLLPDPTCGATRAKQEKRKKKEPIAPSGLRQQTQGLGHGLGHSHGREIKQSQSQTIGNGLEKSIREMLKNYKPTSSERRPFWCRICSFQAQNEEEFYQHRESELHQLTSQQERKMSTCKLCRKEFTSPEQLKEHLKGKGHVERLETLKSKQNGKKFER
jgi:hypothetical protein